MWLARFFGGRSKLEDDEPARFAPPESAQPLQPVKRSQRGGSAKAPAAAATPKDKSGFDPYNSGTFERSNAWERVIRR